MAYGAFDVICPRASYITPLSLARYMRRHLDSVPLKWHDLARHIADIAEKTLCHCAASLTVAHSQTLRCSTALSSLHWSGY